MMSKSIGGIGGVGLGDANSLLMQKKTAQNTVNKIGKPMASAGVQNIGGFGPNNGNMGPEQGYSLADRFSPDEYDLDVIEHFRQEMGEEKFNQIANGTNLYDRTVRETWKIPGLSYEDEMERMYKGQMEDYKQHTQPLIKQLEGEVDSTDLIDRSRFMSENIGERSRQMSDRQRGYSMSGELASQQNASMRSIDMNTAKARGSIMTQGYADQRNKQQAARTQLMSISEQLQQSGTASMSQAAKAKNQRDAAHKAAKGGFMSQVGAVAGTVIGAYFGPAGAAAGGAIGGAVGGAVGG